jgi:hypothetical protein
MGNAWLPVGVWVLVRRRLDGQETDPGVGFLGPVPRGRPSNSRPKVVGDELPDGRLRLDSTPAPCPSLPGQLHSPLRDLRPAGTGLAADRQRLSALAENAL